MSEPIRYGWVFSLCGIPASTHDKNLRLNNRTYSEFFIDGYRARYLNIRLQDNPYRSGSNPDQETEWLLGWDRADHDLMVTHSSGQNTRTEPHGKR